MLKLTNSPANKHLAITISHDLETIFYIFSLLSQTLKNWYFFVRVLFCFVSFLVCNPVVGMEFERQKWRQFAGHCVTEK